MSQLDRQRARAEALAKKQELTDAIAQSQATPEQKAFLQQHVEHLWDFADKAMGGEECRP